MKKFMIRCDVEGVSGVVSYEQAEPGKPEFEFARKMFMSDLLALVDGLNSGGADAICIYDEHYYGRNIDISELPENCAAICGKPPYGQDWAGGLDASFAGLILLGFHSKRGSGELLHHSYEPDIKDLLLNGVSVGEIGIEAAVAGDYDVPLVMLTADSAGIAEAEELCPGVKGVIVKESLSPDGALCYSGKRTAKMIAETAENVAENPPKATPYKVREPELEVHFKPGIYADKFRELFKCGDFVRIAGATVTECWAGYWRMKLATQRALK